MSSKVGIKYVLVSVPTLYNAIQQLIQNYANLRFVRS